jgi:hypothetical protein
MTDSPRPNPYVRMKAAHELLKLKAKGITSDPIEPEPAYKVIIPDHPMLN